MTGKVWLVGAGPGDAGLLTLRGKQVLEQADVVVYDALVGQGVLNLIPEDAELVFAGKRAGHHYLKQEETSRLLLEEALKGRRVVRLKGGEELELLAARDVPFEVVPGVTSAFAVPAYGGIPVTHRDFCSSVHIVTGHRRADCSCGIDFDALVRTKGTLVFLMGVAALPDICGGLLAAGMAPDTPSAALEKGTTAAQRRVSAPLSGLEEACARARVRTPAVIVVGRVCALAETFAWYEKRPLAGVKALVTRPREAGSGLADLLRQRGAEVLELPAIRTRPISGALDGSIRELERDGYDWVVFTSPGGVRVFFERLLEISDVRALARVRIAAVGQGTRRALLQHGLKADFLPLQYDGETLGKELAQVCRPNERVLIPRASLGGPALADELRGAGKGLHVSDIPAYDTVYTGSRVIDARAALERGEIDFAVFTSASTVRGFAAGVGEMDYSKVRAVCIGKQTQAAALEYGMRTWVAGEATLQSLADCVERAAGELILNFNKRIQNKDEL